MKNVFLDAQIWLDLYSFSNDDLTQFNKLKDMLNTDIKLFVTEQIQNEVNRNRENKIKLALAQFQDINIQFPNLCKGYDSFITLFKTYNTFKTLHKELISNLKKDIEDETLYADKIIKECFEKVTIIPYSEDIINKSILRYKYGNPPGKENSYGDAINWESLLESVPNNEDLFFISADKDFRSPINDKSLCKFLSHEWKDKKNSEIYFYTSLTMFLNEHIKEIQLKSENKKAELIEQLKNSPHFETTHSIIYDLDKYDSWTDDQVFQLFSAADFNSQVYWIIADEDITDFYKKIYKQNPELINSKEEFQWILEKLGINEEKESDKEITF